jgi:hypothetical protein
LVLKLISPQIHLLIPEIYNDFFLVHFYQFAKINGFIRLVAINLKISIYLLKKQIIAAISVSGIIFGGTCFKPLSLITLSVNS